MTFLLLFQMASHITEYHACLNLRSLHQCRHPRCTIDGASDLAHCTVRDSDSATPEARSRMRALNALGSKLQR